MRSTLKAQHKGLKVAHYTVHDIDCPLLHFVARCIDLPVLLH